MSIGYACLTIAVRDAEFRRCVLKNCDKSKFLSVIDNNLKSLFEIFKYNSDNSIKLFRISSDLIPFGSSNEIPYANWEVHFIDDFIKLGELIKKEDIRVSMHPGQYTVLNSPNQDVVCRAVKDLEYHEKILSLLNTDKKNKILLHVGGAYGDKKSAIDRFKLNYDKLSFKIKDRLIIENDDKIFNIEDVLGIGNSLGIPVVYDNLHNLCNQIKNEQDSVWIKEAGKTWRSVDGQQKIHYSQQNPEKRAGAHSETIDSMEFLSFFNSLYNKNIDIMLEVKDKNISAIKCNNILKPKIKNIDSDWGRYKYSVLEKSEKLYLAVRELLKGDKIDNVGKLYSMIEEALKLPENKGQFINSAQHVWGYFKAKATEKEKLRIIDDLNSYQKGIVGDKIIKKELWRLAKKYKEDYLINSYYFNEVR